jgi:hypothetical protein
MDGYGLNQRVGVWFMPDDCMVFEQ